MDTQKDYRHWLLQTRSSLTTRHFLRAHDVHYAPQVQQLVWNANRARPFAGVVRELPAPKYPDVPIGTVVEARLSSRAYGEPAISQQSLATVLDAGVGVRRRDGVTRRTVPTSGGLASVGLYVVVNRVEGIAPGIYRFEPFGNHLQLIKSADCQAWLRHVALFQQEFSEAAAAICVVSAFGRISSKYGDRAIRLGFLDSGVALQAMVQAATALDLAQCPTAGFIDDELCEAFEIDGITAAPTIVLLIGNHPSPR